MGRARSRGCGDGALVSSNEGSNATLALECFWPLSCTDALTQNIDSERRMRPIPWSAVVLSMVLVGQMERRRFE
jgi:hypothetical protein